ncbi:MAG: arginine--tRNA ligase [Oscillospiraceae bacterium]|jgi:arginyl-tRNA synthetase|nr:arginine--tRNA ligase [Oscillospiraceae bacterium]
MKSRLAAAVAGAYTSAFAAEPPRVPDLCAMLEVPPDPAMGDYALPCFRFAKDLRRSPQSIASALAAAWLSPDLADCAVAGGYLNFALKRGAFTTLTLDAIRSAGDSFAASDEGAGKTIVIDYSSINIAKRMHIGHLWTTMIGHSLKRLFEHLGYKVVGINHLGDWGTQFGKMISAYKRWGSREGVERGGVPALVDLYVRFHKEAALNPALEDEGREWFLKIERGDSEAMELFNWFKELTLRDVERTYRLLGVTFDEYTGESFYIDKMEPVVDELRAKGLLTLSEGASIVDLSADGIPPALILKSDGATLYTTRDLAAAIYRARTYHFDKCLYVVAYHQDLHFRQLFRVLELMGYPWAKDLAHVSYGMVSYEGAPLSTREGRIVYLDDVLDAAITKARALIDEKSPNLPDKDATARAVGIGAIVYAALGSGRIKDVDFRWSRALNFDGETGPYVQYTHARCCSVLSKASAAGLDWSEEREWSPESLGNDEAQAVLLLLSRYPEAVSDAAHRYEPSILTRHVTQIAQAYNRYYYEHRILDGEAENQRAGVILTEAVRDVLRKGLYLLGIDAPERM